MQHAILVHSMNAFMDIELDWVDEYPNEKKVQSCATRPWDSNPQPQD